MPLVEALRRVSPRMVTRPIQSQGIITRDNVSVDVSAVAYYRVTDAARSVVAIENVAAQSPEPGRAGVDHNTTVVFPAPPMSAIQELGAFLSREQAAGTTPAPTATPTPPAEAPAAPAGSPAPAVQVAATEAGFNTDYNGAPPAQPR